MNDLTIAEITRRLARLQRRIATIELELLGARNRAEHAISVACDKRRPIAPGLILNARDLEVLLTWTASKAGEVEGRILDGDLLKPTVRTLSKRRL